MAHFNNPQTAALKLVQEEIIQRGWFTPAPTINVEEGFILEHYRGNMHINSFSSHQLSSPRRAPDAKDGDIIFRLNLGPRPLLVEGSLLTWEGYQRSYRFVVDLQMRQPAQLFLLYRQEADPVALVVRSITEELQKYASRTLYEDINPLNFVAKVESIFDHEPYKCKAGLAILEVHDPVLSADPHYKPVPLRQILPLTGTIPTQDGYKRNYEVQIELEVVNLFNYKRQEREGDHPLNLVQTALNDDLQRYAYTLFYEEQTTALLQTYLETRTLATFPGQIRAGVKVVRAYNFVLGPGSGYKPVAKTQRLTLTGMLKTLEKYERPYKVDIELQVANLHDYLKRTGENTAPLGLAQAAIEGEILQFAAGQKYEALNSELLRQKVERAFDKFTGRTTGGLQIKAVHFFDLEDAQTYVTIQVLEMDGVIRTSDLFACPYTLTVELQIADGAKYVQLKNENANHLNLVKEAIAGAIVKLAHGKTHEEVIHLDLTEAARGVFKQATNTMIAGLRIVRAHKAEIQVDANVQARADIVNGKNTDLTRVGAREEVLIRTQDAEANLRLAAEDQNLKLARKQGETEQARLEADLRRDQMVAMSQAYTEFFQKVFQIETENLVTGTSTQAEVLQNIQKMLQITQGNVPQIGAQAGEHEQPQLQGGPQPVRALKSGQTDEDDAQIIEAAAAPQPARRVWLEAGLVLMEVPLPTVLLPYMEGATTAFQIQKIEAESPARLAGMRKGDFLVGIEEEETYTADAFDKAYASVTGQTSVTIYTRHPGQPLDDYTLQFCQNEKE